MNAQALFESRVRPAGRVGSQSEPATAPDRRSSRLTDVPADALTWRTDPVQALLGTEGSRWWWLSIPVALAALVLYLALKWLFIRVDAHSWWGTGYTTLVTMFLVTRVGFGLTYRGTRAMPAELPSVSIIVPVKNEEMMIGNTIHRLFATGYPADRFEVVVVNDGSTDGTETVVRIAQRIYPGLRVVSLPRNVGKREAMAIGIESTKSEAVVFIDSDTLIETGSLNRLVRALSDKRIGAVAGRTKILNHRFNTLTRVQALIYDISFRIHKAAEARFGTVTCCPGCFSVYRRSAIMPLLETWRNEEFLGSDTIFGDDRSLTMMLLRDNWKVSYEPTAVAHTEAPASWRGYLRQQLRWKKSWLQQGWRAIPYMWRRHPMAAVWFYTGLFLSIAGPHVAVRALLIGPLIDHAFPWRFVIGFFCVAALIAAWFCAAAKDLGRLRAVLVLPFVSLLLALQMPVAIARLADAKWGTR